MINARDSHPGRAAAGQHQQITARDCITELLGQLRHFIRRDSRLNLHLQDRITAQELKKLLHR